MHQKRQNSDFQAQVAIKTKMPLCFFHKEIVRHIQEKEELHLGLEKAESIPKRVSPKAIKGLENVLSALHHLPPSIFIKQVYHTTKDLTLMSNELPYLQPKAKLIKDVFIILWKQTQPEAKDTLAFMWAIGDSRIPLGVLEVVAAIPSFYISRFCVRATQSYATQTIKDFEHTVAKKNSLLHTKDNLLLPPTSNPCHWRAY